MNAFNTIFKFESASWIKEPLIYITGFILFSISLLTMWGMSAEANTTGSVVMMNSYYKINNMATLFALFLVFLLPAIIGNVVFKDFKSRMYTLLYSFPFSKRDYLGAKFLSAFLAVTVLVCVQVLGLFLGTLMPGVKQAVILPFDGMNYLQLIVVFLLPNMLLFGSIVWALTLRTRNVYIAFIGVILMMIVQNFGEGVLGSKGFDMMAALVDPTGENAVKYVVRFWSLNERNFNSLPISGMILYNRVLWLTISIAILGWSYMRFEFNQFTKDKRGSKKNTRAAYLVNKRVSFISFPPVSLRFSLSDRIKTVWHLSNVQLRAILFSWPFLAILFAGGVLVVFQQYKMGPQEGVVAIPTTANMLRFPMFYFSMIVNLLTFLYAGVLIYKDRLHRMDGLTESTPQTNWMFLSTNLLSLLKMQYVLLTLVLVGGVVVQLLAGYDRFEFGHYLFELYVLHGLHFFAWACLALCIHAVIERMYLGYFVLLLVSAFNIFLPSLGDYLGIELLKENLVQFNSVKGIFIGFDYSDFNGYGWQLATYFAYKLYWVIGSAVLLLVSLLAWKRGNTFTVSERWQSVRLRCVGVTKYALSVSLLLFFSMGFNIYYQEHYISKVMFSDKEMERLSVANEKRFGHFKNTVQPRLCDVNMTMDIYPETKDFVAKGVFTYVNRVDEMIDTIVIAKSFKEQTTCTIMQPHQVLVQDDDLQYDVVALASGLAKGDSLRIEIEIRNYPNSFLHHNSRVISNGTYLTEKIIPRLGYKQIDLTSAKDRRKYGLAERAFPERLSGDTNLLGYANADNDMGQINYECVLSTSDDQQGLTMGVLERTWTSNGRVYSHFRSNGPVANKMSWVSGTYQQVVSSQENQRLELYRHPVHDQNDSHIFNGLSSSLNYCSKWFGPLDHTVHRIVEFPVTEGTYATVRDNLVLCSESYFTCDVHNHENEVFNMPFFVAAHEIAHAWWGHRVDPANIPGGRMITEGLADYLAMKATETVYGKDKVLSLRKNYHKLYLEERGQRLEEAPLINADLNADFLNYRKSALALYAMSEFLGEEEFNKAMASFEKRYANAEPPFATSANMVEYIREATPDSLEYLVHDLFNTITFYGNELANVQVEEVAGEYKVDIDFTVSKYRTDEYGKRSYGDRPLIADGYQSLPLADYVDVGIYGENNQLIAYRRLFVEEIQNAISINTDQRVTRVQIDPNYLLFDVNRENYTWIAEER